MRRNIILFAIALAPQLFFNGCADAYVTSISEILSAIARAQFQYCRLSMIVFQSNVIKVKEKTFTRYVGVARIFDLRGGPNCKSHAMRLSNFFKKGDFLRDKNIVKWRIRSRDLGWYVTWILRKGKDLNHKLKFFPKLSKLEDGVSKLVYPKRITNLGLGAGRWAIFSNFWGKKITILGPFGSYFARF